MIGRQVWRPLICALRRGRKTGACLFVHGYRLSGRFRRAVFPLLGLPRICHRWGGTTMAATAASRPDQLFCGQSGLCAGDAAAGIRHGPGRGASRPRRYIGGASSMVAAIWDQAEDTAWRDLQQHGAGLPLNKRAINAFRLNPGSVAAQSSDAGKGMDVSNRMAGCAGCHPGELQHLTVQASKGYEAAFRDAATAVENIDVVIGYDENWRILLQGDADASSRYRCASGRYGLRAKALYGLAWHVPVAARTALERPVIDADRPGAGVATRRVVRQG